MTIACPICGFSWDERWLGTHVEGAHQAELAFLYENCEACYYAIFSDHSESLFGHGLPEGQLRVIVSELTEHLADVGGYAQHVLLLALEDR